MQINPISKQHRTNGLLAKTINIRKFVNRFLRSPVPNPLPIAEKAVSLTWNEKSVAKDERNSIYFLYFVGGNNEGQRFCSDTKEYDYG